MDPLHSLARSCLAPLFVAGGVDALRHPGLNADELEKVTPVMKSWGVSRSPEQLVRLNGALQLSAGLLLSAGRVPRVASTALAVSLVPTTLMAHRFWEETDPTIKSAQRIQFYKNLALFGGLLMAAVDRHGSPSLTWRAKRGAKHANQKLHSVTASLSQHGAHDSLTDRGTELASNMGSLIAEKATHLADTAQSRATSFIGSH
jgi:uncharacterized membrane protein YphA (DoxX/SURF4 family)